MNITMTTIRSLWIFHPIGTGVIITYNTKTQESRWVSEATGITFQRQFIPIPYKSIQEFKEEGIKMYSRLIDDGVSLSMNYYDNPTIIETKTGNVAIDLDVLKN